MGQCKHNRYRTSSYMQSGQIREVTSHRSTNNIAWYSAQINKCADCGADISQYKLHEVMTGEEYLAYVGFKPEPEMLKRESHADRMLRHEKSVEKQGSLL